MGIARQFIAGKDNPLFFCPGFDVSSAERTVEKAAFQDGSVSFSQPRFTQ
jgi:hypothetical protein